MIKRVQCIVSFCLLISAPCYGYKNIAKDNDEEKIRVLSPGKIAAHKRVSVSPLRQLQEQVPHMFLAAISYGNVELVHSLLGFRAVSIDVNKNLEGHTSETPIDYVIGMYGESVRTGHAESIMQWSNMFDVLLMHGAQTEPGKLSKLTGLMHLYFMNKNKKKPISRAFHMDVREHFSQKTFSVLAACASVEKKPFFIAAIPRDECEWDFFDASALGRAAQVEVNSPLTGGSLKDILVYQHIPEVNVSTFPFLLKTDYDKDSADNKELTFIKSLAKK